MALLDQKLDTVRWLSGKAVPKYTPIVYENISLTIFLLVMKFIILKYLSI